jgi:hypothetical protein
MIADVKPTCSARNTSWKKCSRTKKKWFSERVFFTEIFLLCQSMSGSGLKISGLGKISLGCWNIFACTRSR